MKNYIINSIDIGTTKVVAIISKVFENGQMQILGIGTAQSFGVKKGVVANIEEATKDIAKAVAIAESQAGLKMKEVYIGIACQHIRIQRTAVYRTITTHTITEKDLKAIKKEIEGYRINTGEKILHIVPQEYLIDDHPAEVKLIGSIAKKLEVNYNIIISKEDSINNLKRCIDRLGLKVSKIVLEPIASASAVLSEDYKELGVALVDIGGGTTDLAIYKNGVLSYASVIAYGGNNITQDVSKGCEILEKYAEQLKIKCGSAIVNKEDSNTKIAIKGLDKEISLMHLSGIIQARMKEILEGVMYKIETAGFKDKLPSGIVITGGGALLKNVVQLTGFVSGTSASLGRPNKYIKGEVIDNLQDNPIYSTAIGLVIEGLNDIIENGGETNSSFGWNLSRMFKKKYTLKEEINESQDQEEAKNSKVAGNIFSNFFKDDNDKSM